MGTHACNPNTLEAKAEGSQSQPGLYSESLSPKQGEELALARWLSNKGAYCWLTI